MFQLCVDVKLLGCLKAQAACQTTEETCLADDLFKVGARVSFVCVYVYVCVCARARGKLFKSPSSVPDD